jgi:hypothetical protein
MSHCRVDFERRCFAIAASSFAPYLPSISVVNQVTPASRLILPLAVGTAAIYALLIPPGTI